MDKTVINERFIAAVYKLLDEDENINKGYIAKELKMTRPKLSEILNKRMNIGIDSLAIFCKKFGINPEWVLLGEGEIRKSNGIANLKGIPLNSTSEILNNKINTLCIYKLPDFEQADWLYRTLTTQMEPHIQNGDFLICHEFKKVDFIQWGKCHLIVSKNQGIIIGNLFKGESDDLYKIEFNNPQKYESYEIPISSISKLALIVGVIHSC